MTLGCKSPVGPARGTTSRTARVSTARWNLKEATGKTLARRTGTAYEAATPGKASNIAEAQYLHGRCGRRCGGYKCEGHASYPGKSALLQWSTCLVRGGDGVPELSRGHSRYVTAY